VQGEYPLPENPKGPGPKILGLNDFFFWPGRAPSHRDRAVSVAGKARREKSHLISLFMACFRLKHAFEIKPFV
jgi:hypothetical protein